MSPDQFELSDGERHHPLWLRLRAFMETETDRLRRRNDGPLTEMETASLRGRIQCLKGLCALGDVPPTDG